MNPWDADPIVQPVQAPQGAAPAANPWDADPIVGPAQSATPAGDGSAAVGRGLINGVPVLGPYMLGGVNRLAAGVRSMQNGTPYADELQKVQQFGDATAANNPGATMAGEMAGAAGGTMAILPAEGLGLVGGMGARLAGGAIGGGALGAADSEVRGQDPTSGAALGAAGGAAGPLIGAGVGAGARAVVGALQPVPEALQGAGRIGAKWLQSGLGDATADDIAAAQQKLGPRGFSGELTPGLLDLSGSIADNNGAGKPIIRDAYASRQAGTDGRVNSLVDQTLGPQDTTALQFSKALLDRAKGLGQERADILANAPPVDISPVVAQIQAEIPKTAENTPQRAALVEALNRVRQTNPDAGKPSPGTWEPDFSPVDPNAPPPPPVPDKVPVSDPTQLHGIKQAFDADINYDAKGLQPSNPVVASQQGGYKQFRGGINDALRSAIPEYGPNQDLTAALMRQQQQVREGTMDLGRTQNPADYASMVQSLSPEEIAARQVGNREAVAAKLGKSGNDFLALKNALQGVSADGAPMENGGWNLQNLGSLYGQDAAEGLNAGLNQEAAMKANAQRVVGGSPTGEKVQRSQITQPSPDGGFAGYVQNLYLDKPSTWLPPGMKPDAWWNDNVRGPRFEAARANVAPLLVKQGEAGQKIVDALMQLRDQRGAIAGAGDKYDALVRALLAPAMQAQRQQIQAN